MKRVFPRIFLPLVCLLYACFLVLDLTALADSTWIEYVSILLCFSAAPAQPFLSGWEACPATRPGD